MSILCLLMKKIYINFDLINGHNSFITGTIRIEIIKAGTPPLTPMNDTFI